MANLNVKVTKRGGDKLRRFLREAGKGGVKGIKVGFFSEAKYQDGTPVAAVAAWNEFGTKTIPERPFFRRAVADMEDGVTKILKANIDPEKMVVDRHLADTVGAYAAGQVQESITSLREPPNAPSTIARKRKKLHGKKGTGGENPLIDTGFMGSAVGWSVDNGSVNHPRAEP